MVSFQGSITALVTPFKNGTVDQDAFEALVAWQLEQGTHGFVPCGTTGESPTLSHTEHHRLIELCVKASNGKVPVIAGTGSNATEEAISLTRFAASAGADAALVVTPYYNKPSQEGLFQHFKAIAQATDLPIILYNIPGRSVVDISLETMKRLRDLPNIVGVKDATANLARASLQRQLLGRDFVQLSGEDITALGFMAHGGTGCISVTSNVAPKLCAQFQTACLAGDYKKALEIQDRLTPLHDAMFVEASPGPAKFALSLLGRVRNELRLPVVAISKAAEVRVEAAMASVGLLS